MTEERPVADTPLAQWMNERMSAWVDPQTGRRGLSVNKLAKLSGVSQTAVFEMLKEGSIPRADTLVKFSEFFDVPPMSLFRMVYIEGDEQEKFPAETRAKFMELEEILSDLPAQMQVQFMESLIPTAKMMLTAARAWEKDAVTAEEAAEEEK